MLQVLKKRGKNILELLQGEFSVPKDGRGHSSLSNCSLKSTALGIRVKRTQKTMDCR